MEPKQLGTRWSATKSGTDRNPQAGKEKFEKIIAEQMPNELKKEKADFVVDTSVGIEDAIRQVGEIVKKIKDSK